MGPDRHNVVGEGQIGGVGLGERAEVVLLAPEEHGQRPLPARVRFRL